MFEKDIPYTLAMMAVDEAGNKSPLSNIKNFVLSDKDTPAPGRTMDLEAQFNDPNANGSLVLNITFTAPGNDLYSETPAYEYIIKFSTEALSEENFASTGTQITQEDTFSSMEPVNGNQTVSIVLK